MGATTRANVAPQMKRALCVYTHDVLARLSSAHLFVTEQLKRSEVTINVQIIHHKCRLTWRTLHSFENVDNNAEDFRRFRFPTYFKYQQQFIDDMKAKTIEQTACPLHNIPGADTYIQQASWNECNIQN